MFQEHPARPAGYARFEREVPQWFTDAKLGIFVHWGPYSVPAWAEPIGELGTIEKKHWFAHNPYAEWYANTIRIPGSPAAEHHLVTYDGAPYDDFLDRWTAERFDADEFMALVRRTGARYFVPTTKHHDGVTLWDAPATGDRNTVARGPRRDLVAEFADAARGAGLRFGVYYSGGLDWHFSDLPPITDEGEEFRRPTDAAYARYAYEHVSDLIRRYSPDILWGDIEWPDAGKPPGPYSMERLFEQFYSAAPDGVANDRWGETHWDFRTSEYQNGTSVEGRGAWENCRGIGYSFGYNRLEGAEHTLVGRETVKTFLDVVSRGGNLLLNVGLTAEGTVPDLQRETLESLGDWNQRNGHAVFGSRPFPGAPTSERWNRWTRTSGQAHLFVDGTGTVTLRGAPETLNAASARGADGLPLAAKRTGDRVDVELPSGGDSPALVSFELVGDSR